MGNPAGVPYIAIALHGGGLSCHCHTGPKSKSSNSTAVIAEITSCTVPQQQSKDSKFIEHHPGSKGFQGASSKKLTTARPLGTLKALYMSNFNDAGFTWSHFKSFSFFLIAHQNSSSVKGLFVDLISPLCATSSHILPELAQLLIIWIPAQGVPSDKSCCIPWFLLIGQKRNLCKEAKDPAPVVHCLTEHMLGCCPCLSEILSTLAQGNSKCTAAENRLWLLWALGIFPQGQVITHPTATESIGTGGPGPVSCDVQHVGTNSRSMFPQAHERKTSRRILHQCHV